MFMPQKAARCQPYDEKCGLGRTHLLRALLYVDSNPLRAGLVGRAQEYPWSSARAHTEGADSSGTLDLGSWSEICSANDWGQALLAAADPVDEIRTATRAGNPLGDDRFVAELERKAGRLLRCKPPGPQPNRGPRRPKREFGSCPRSLPDLSRPSQIPKTGRRTRRCASGTGGRQRTPATQSSAVDA